MQEKNNECYFDIKPCEVIKDIELITTIPKYKYMYINRCNFDFLIIILLIICIRNKTQK